MADVNSSSWTCVSGDKVAVFDDVSSVLMTPSPEEVLKNGERLTRQQTFTKEDSANEVVGVMFSGYNDHRQNLVSLWKIMIIVVVVSFNHLIKEKTFITIPSYFDNYSNVLNPQKKNIILNFSNTQVWCYKTFFQLIQCLICKTNHINYYALYLFICKTFRDSSIWFRLESAYNPMNREDVYHVVKDVRGMASKELRCKKGVRELVVSFAII